LNLLLPSSVELVNEVSEGVGADVGAEVQDSNSDDEERKALDPKGVGDGCAELSGSLEVPANDGLEDTSSEADSVGCVGSCDITPVEVSELM
jgi:hypothetical protein